MSSIVRAGTTDESEIHPTVVPKSHTQTPGLRVQPLGHEPAVTVGHDLRSRHPVVCQKLAQSSYRFQGKVVIVRLLGQHLAQITDALADGRRQPRELPQNPLQLGF